MGLYQGDVGDDSLVGSNYDDQIFGGVAIWSPYGGYYYSDGAGRDKLYGAGGNDSIYGGASSDTIDGGSGNDYLYGGAGNDTIIGGAGNDRLAGEDGGDIYVFSGSFGQDQIISDGYYGSANLVNFVGILKAQVTFDLDASDLYIYRTGTSDRVLINDWQYYSNQFTLQFSDGVANPSFLNPTEGADTLVGGDAAETVSGLGGNDIVYGGDGDDRVLGGNGNDVVYGGNGNDIVAGDDGTDNLFGGDGNDSLRGSNGDDYIYGGNGSDSVVDSSGKDVIYGGNGTDLLRGDADNDTIFGEGSNDSLSGGDGNDYLSGAVGSDTLNGGVGVDNMFGGIGNDRFVFDDGDSGLGALRDRIGDFSSAQADKIDLSLIDANTGAGGDQAFTVWKGTAALTGAGQVGYYTSGGTTIIRGSVDADSASEFEIQLTAGLTPNSSWFIF